MKQSQLIEAVSRGTGYPISRVQQAVRNLNATGSWEMPERGKSADRKVSDALLLILACALSGELSGVQAGQEATVFVNGLQMIKATNSRATHIRKQRETTQLPLKAFLETIERQNPLDVFETILRSDEVRKFLKPGSDDRITNQFRMSIEHPIPRLSFKFFEDESEAVKLSYGGAVFENSVSYSYAGPRTITITFDANLYRELFRSFSGEFHE